MGKLIANKFTAWQQECETRFATLKSNEEELNHIFINIYAMQNVLTPDAVGGEKWIVVSGKDKTKILPSTHN